MTIEDRNKAEVGDRVRVTYEAPVTDKNGYTIWIRGVALDTYNTLAQVEIIEKAKPKVGDVIEGPAAYAALPVSAVVKGANGILIMRVSGGWSGSDGWNGAPGARLQDKRTLVYLP